ncbi:MAG TPA: hypothetical protein VIU33_07865, partial [Nitrospiria bacterium]
MDAVEIAKKRSIPGFMIFDHQRKPVFWSPGVAAILKEDGQDLETEPSGDQKISIPEEITGLISRLRKNDSAPGFPSGDLS